MPDSSQADDDVWRLAALVVAPDLEKTEKFCRLWRNAN